MPDPKNEKKPAEKKASVKPPRDLSKGAKTDVDLTQPITFNTDPTQIDPNANVGAWNAYSKFLGSQTVNGQPLKGNANLNSAEAQAYTQKTIDDFNSSDYVKQFPNNKMTPEQIKYAQEYHKRTDPNVQVDNWVGSQTSRFTYPTPQTLMIGDKKTLTPSDTSGFIPVIYGNKDYVIPAAKQATGKVNITDYVPYDPNVHGAKLQRGNVPSTYANRFPAPVTTNTTAPVTPPVQQRAKGGLIKGYAQGGTTKYNESLGDLNSAVVGQNDEYSKQREIDDAKKKEEKKAKNANTTKALGATTMAIGNSVYKKPVDIYANEKEEAVNSTLNSTIDSMASSLTPWYGLAMGASKMGRSALSKDKYGDTTKGASRTAEEWMTPSHEKAVDSFSKGDVLGGLRDITGTGTLVRGITKGLEKDEDTTGFWGEVNKLSGNASENEKRNKPFTQQLGEVNAANIKDKQAQALAARNANNFNAKITTKYDVGNNPKYDENKRLLYNDGQVYMGEEANGVSYAKGGIIKKIKNMYSEGGEIKGKGGPKEDKIKAEVKEGSFVVPAENAELAKGIRKLYLKAPLKKAKLKQEGGEDVKLSDGEHLFTPEENEYLESIGVDLEGLAPNADDDKDAYGDGGLVKGTKHNGATWNGKEWVSDAGKFTEEKQKSLTKSYNDYVNSENAKRLPSLKRNYDYIKNDPSRKAEADKLKSKIDELSGASRVTETPKSESKPSVKAPVYKAKTKENISGKEFTPKMTEDDGQFYSVPGDNLSPNERRVQNEKDNINNANAKKLNDSALAVGKQVVEVPKPDRKGLAGVIGNIDPTLIVGAGQTAMGLKMLKGETRPIDNIKLDKAYNENVERSIKDASFGLTPEQKFQATQDIENAKRDAMFQGVNYSGGNASQAYNLNRSAINDAWKNKLGLKQADTDMRMQKQQYADQQVANRANILSANRRTAFSDAMDAFHQKQQAGSELIGTGLANTIGAYRFAKYQEERRKREGLDWSKNYQPPV